jgi:hypothetical protein
MLQNKITVFLAKKAPPRNRDSAFLNNAGFYLQQSAFKQLVLAHLSPLGQLVQVACFAFASLAGTWVFAMAMTPAKAIASTLKMSFFI